MAAVDGTAAQRTYRGRTTAERVAERRARLEEAALEVIGTRGWAEATMTEICRVAGLTERYFYESFRSREALYEALLDDLGEELRAAVFGAAAQHDGPAERMRASSAALVAQLVGDPRRGRAALLEGIGLQGLEQRRREAILGLFDLLGEQWETFFPQIAADPAERRLRATAIGGAAVALISRRLDGTLDVDDATLAEALSATGTAIAAASIAGTAIGRQPPD